MLNYQRVISGGTKWMGFIIGVGKNYRFLSIDWFINGH
jgi:hypothetical protein